MTHPTTAEIAQQSLSILPAALRRADFEERLALYLDELLRTNESINLVSRRDTVRHVARFTRECVFLGRLLHEDGRRRAAADAPMRLLDLGSGGGFPGLVLKLMLPDVETTLVESTQKKARFLAETCRVLDLRQMTVIWARAEDLANREASVYRPEFRHAFDWVTAKALGKLLHSTRLAIPFLAVEGVHWTFKGADARSELKRCDRLFKQARLERFRLEKIPGDVESYVVAVQRRPPAEKGADQAPRQSL